MIDRALPLCLLVLLAFAPPAQACGPESDCVIGERIYRIRMPEGHDGKTPVPAIVFAHGYRGSATGIIRNEALADLASDLGVALIAAKSAGDDWSIPGAPAGGKIAGVDELVYFDRLLEDAADRFPINRERLLATGFSAGGMMVWNLICHRSDSFAAFVPMAGTFWQPEPQSCTSPPADVIHIHGGQDKIVPLTGRAIEESHQGDIGKVLGMYADYGNYASASSMAMDGLDCERRVNPEGKILAFCLFKGGHSFNQTYLRQAWHQLMQP